MNVGGPASRHLRTLGVKRAIVTALLAALSAAADARPVFEVRDVDGQSVPVAVGLPAVSLDGRRVAYAYRLRAPNTEMWGLELRIVDAATSRLIERQVLVKLDETDWDQSAKKQGSPEPAELGERVRRANARLAGSSWAWLTPLEVAPRDLGSSSYSVPRYAELGPDLLELRGDQVRVWRAGRAVLDRKMRWTQVRSRKIECVNHAYARAAYADLASGVLLLVASYTGDDVCSEPDDVWTVLHLPERRAGGREVSAPRLAVARGQRRAPLQLFHDGLPAVSADGGRFAVVEERGHRLQALDAATGAVLRSEDLPDPAQVADPSSAAEVEAALAPARAALAETTWTPLARVVRGSETIVVERVVPWDSATIPYLAGAYVDRAHERLLLIVHEVAPAFDPTPDETSFHVVKLR
jgi:hypothetical protein